MRVVLLTSDTTWQRSLAQRLARVPAVTLAGIVVQDIPRTRPGDWIRKRAIKDPGRVLDRILRSIVYRGLHQQIAREELAHFGQNLNALPWPVVPRAEVEDINGHEALHAMRQFGPDLIVVSGTRMIKAPVFEIQPPRGLLNLHTGISPIYKGGPNCTLWCLANGEPGFIGSTIHILDPGIDSGDIVASARVNVEAFDTAGTLVCKAVAIGHSLYADVVGALAAGASLRPVPQAMLGEGRTYLTREWGLRPTARADWYVRTGKLRRWVESGCPGSERVPLVSPRDTVIPDARSA